MQTITLAEAQARLPELIDSLPAKKEIIITRDDQTVAVILPKTGQGSSDEVTRAREEGSALSQTPRSISGRKTFSVGQVLKPDFNREESGTE